MHSLRKNCPNTRKYGPEKTPYLNTFHAVIVRPKTQSNTAQLSKTSQRSPKIIFWSSWHNFKKASFCHKQVMTNILDSFFESFKVYLLKRLDSDDNFVGKMMYIKKIKLNFRVSIIRSYTISLYWKSIC